MCSSPHAHTCVRGVRACMGAGMRACVRACVRACMRVCVRECVRACMYDECLHTVKSTPASIV